MRRLATSTRIGTNRRTVEQVHNGESAIKKKLGLIVGLLIGNQIVARGESDAAGPVALPKALQSAAANTWVKIGEAGGRLFPMLFYNAPSNSFVVGLGGGNSDVEELDLVSGRWQRQPTTVVGGGKPIYVQDGRAASAFFQYATVPEMNKVFVYAWNRTSSYDPASRQWEDLKAAPSPGDHDGSYFQGTPGGLNAKHNAFWSALCWDPVNHEVLLSGGRSAERGGAPGTWAYTPASNSWRKLEFGTLEEMSVLAKANALVRSVWLLLSAARGRYFIAETEAEAKADLMARATEVTDGITELVGALKGTPRALQALGDAAVELKKANAGLGGKISRETLLTLAGAHRLVEAAVRDLAVEPPARMDAQMAYDAASKKIVLFGGDGGDRMYADTWVYDCATRQWEQRTPAVVPPPRAGAAVLHLPKSGKILLAGGYTSGFMNFKDEPHMVLGRYEPVNDMWTYDVTANQWALLWRAEAQQGPAGIPVSRGVYGIPAAWPAAVNTDDVVVVFGAGDKATSATWACRVDATKTIDAGTYGVAAGTVTMNRSTILPEAFEKAATPDRTAEDAFLASLPVNSWQKFKCPLDAPCRDWGSTMYDPTRHQMLYWGGGHVSYHLTDVNHFSLAAGVWTSSYTPEWTRLGGFGGLGTVTFNNRPDIPVHAYRFYTYDVRSDRLVFSFGGLTRTYSVAERDWDPQVVKNPFRTSHFNEVVTATPHGAVIWTDNPGKLWLWDGATRSWSALPMKVKLPEPYSDRSGMCYDAKRDCVWISDGNASPMRKYDFKTGDIAEFTGLPTTALNAKMFNIREMAYVADQDLIFIADCGRGLLRDGKLAKAEVVFDPESGKWSWAAIANPTMGHGWGTGLAYDPLYKVLLNSDSGTVTVLKLDRRTAGLEEIKE